MSTSIAVRPEAGDIVENVIAKGDLGKLTPEQRTQYYVEVCKSVGLNPLSQPFAYITLNGKLTLYALRGCTDQLRAIHKVSVIDMAESERDGVYAVTVKVQDASGRTDMAKGAVTVTNLKGDNLANALMKAETKAKRRATLSICGLGFLDESEIETIPLANRGAPLKRTQVEISAAKKGREDVHDQFIRDLDDVQNLVALKRFEDAWADKLRGDGGHVWTMQERLETKRKELSAPVEDEPVDEETGELQPPQTRAEYVQECHEKIEAFTSKLDLAAWWGGESMARRRFSLNKAEIDDMKERVTARRDALTEAPFGVDKAGNPLHPLQAG